MKKHYWLIAFIRQSGDDLSQYWDSCIVLCHPLLWFKQFSELLKQAVPSFNEHLILVSYQEITADEIAEYDLVETIEEMVERRK